MEDNGDTENTEILNLLHLMLESGKKHRLKVLVAVIVIVIYVVLSLTGKGISLRQIIDFFNVWPIALGLSVSVVAVCIAYVTVECNRQKNKTARAKITGETDKERADRLEAEKQALEQSLTAEKEKNLDLSIQNVRLESRIELLEREKELIEQNNSRGGERITERRFLAGGRNGS